MVSFVAPSGTGKTTMLESVVQRLTDRGHRIGAVKHDAHRIELDTEGKDSWRLRQAGADSTLLMGRNQFAWFGNDDAGPSLAEAVSLFCRGCDLVVVEGFRSARLPSIVITRAGHSDDRWEPPAPDTVLATVSPDEVDRVVSLLVERFLDS
jgi:molybdopterin-guanine dinucleotide biosynthesis protein MobB